MQNADVVIHDSQYTPEEYPAKKNWGHSTYSYVTQLAAAANVKRLFLTHHDPAHDDDFLERIENRAGEIARQMNSPMRVSCAREGHSESFAHASEDRSRMNDISFTAVDSSDSLSILIVDDDEDLRVLARKILSKAGHRVLEAADGEAGLSMIENQHPDLVLLDLNMPAPNGYEVLQILRSRPATRLLPVVVLTAQGDEESVRRSFDTGATGLSQQTIHAAPTRCPRPRRALRTRRVNDRS